jgi:hypothetical protein
MRAKEFLQEAIPLGFNVYSAWVKIKNPLYNNSMEVAVFAKNPSMARALLQAQYGKSATITNVNKVA